MTDVSKRRPRRACASGKTRERRSGNIEDEEIKTITYDEYVNAGIPDALLQGLGFAESLSEEPMDVENPNDSTAKAPAEHLEIPEDVSSSDIQAGPSGMASAPMVPVSLVQLLIGRNGSELPGAYSSASISYNNIVSDTPSAVNFVDKDGKILPTLPPVPSLVGNTAGTSLIGGIGSERIGPQAVTYVDQNGRVLGRVPLPGSDPSPAVRVVDSDGRIITSQGKPNAIVADKDGRVISGARTSPPGKVGISRKNASSESDARDFKPTLPITSDKVIGSVVKVKESATDRISSEDLNRAKRPLRRPANTTAPVQVQAAKRMTQSIARDEASAAKLPRNRQTDQQPNHSVSNADARVSSRTKGQVRYDRLPTGEVVASIVREGPESTSTKQPTRRVVPSVDSVGTRGRLAADSSFMLPEDYPINQANVTTVVEEAHRATQSMRILLCSMREELRRAGGLGSDGSNWTAGQLTQRRNITHRLAVAYQSYRKSIRDIENVQFRSGNPAAAGGGNSTRVNSRIPSSDAVVVSSSSADDVRMQHTSDTGDDSDQVVDLTL